MSKEKQALKKLTEIVAVFLSGLDSEMKKPESAERGVKIAKLCNALDFANDSTMHFDLGYSFKKIKKMKK